MAASCEIHPSHHHELVYLHSGSYCPGNDVSCCQAQVFLNRRDKLTILPINLRLLGGFTKLTFCALYLRIFSQKGFATLVMVVSAIVAAGSLAFTLGTVFQCTPVHRAWDRRISGHCINNEAFWYSHAVFNIFFDIVVRSPVSGCRMHSVFDSSCTATQRYVAAAEGSSAMVSTNALMYALLHTCT